MKRDSITDHYGTEVTEGRAIAASLERQNAFFRKQNELEEHGRCPRHLHEVRGRCPECGETR